MLIRSSLALLLAASVALASPPTDDQVDTLVKNYTANRAKSMEVSAKLRELMAAMKTEETASGKAEIKELQNQIKELGDANRAAVKELSLEEATLPQIEKLVTAQLAMLPEVSKAISRPLAELAKSETKNGARAAELHIQYFPAAASAKAEDREAREEQLAAAYVKALNHPGLPELLKEGKGTMLLSRLGTMKAEDIEAAKVMPTFEKLLAHDLSVNAVASLGGVVKKVRDVASSGDRDRVLDKIAAAADSAVSKAPESTTPAMLKRAKDTAKLARSGWARGTLIGGAAPEMAFHWSSDPKITKLSDLKGKVVLVDFWATWCGPCVASFPKMRQLQERYKEYDVVILGVTSIQGRHIDQTAKPAKSIDCKDDPKKEVGLMPEFMTGMNMTWPVVFTEDGCFNPNYGVSGIPHLALIDPSGKVRYNELRPRDPAEEAEKIDELLKEFKLKAPSEAMPKMPAPKPVVPPAGS